MLRTYFGTLLNLGHGLVDLGVPGPAAQTFIDEVLRHYGPLPGSAKLRVWVLDDGVAMHELVSRGRGTDVFGVVHVSTYERPTKPMSPAAWELVLNHQYLLPHIAGKLSYYVRILGRDETLAVLQRELELRAAAFDKSRGLPFSVYVRQAMVQSVKRAADRQLRDYDRTYRTDDREDYEEFPVESRTVFGGGRQRFDTPYENACLREEYPDYAAACC